MKRFERTSKVPEKDWPLFERDARQVLDTAQEFDRTNIEGTENLLQASMLAKVKRVVHTSTVMVIGPTDGFIADESAYFAQ